ncbi:MAG: hypothetical protein QOJ51_1321 [Acidobacteriaceae bacterium]|nr:hypothetical protein [Acidobacteriaceae bacterium]
MKGALSLFLGFISMTQPVHVRNSFQLLVRAPLARAATLFGPDGERCWAGPHWNPEFLYPQPGKDVQGAVFTIQHGPHKSVWVNTLFDPSAGLMQYVSFIPETLVSTVDVRLTAVNLSSTSVKVTYARTALDAAANDEVEALGKRDRESGPEWQQAIEKCLATRE